MGGWVPGKEAFLGLFAETSLWPLCTGLQVILASDDLMISATRPCLYGHLFSKTLKSIWYLALEGG